LTEPAEYKEKTSGLYRFELELPHGETTFAVKEEETRSRKIEISSYGLSNLISHTSNQEISESARAGIKRAVELYQKIDDEEEKLTELQNRIERLYGEQERTRKNLEAAGSQTQQGQNYLVRLSKQEDDIDAANQEIAAAEQSVKTAQQEYDKYIQEMTFGE
jgi:myosin heavy subunit